VGHPVGTFFAGRSYVRNILWARIIIIIIAFKCFYNDIPINNLTNKKNWNAHNINDGQPLIKQTNIHFVLFMAFVILQDAVWLLNLIKSLLWR